jgi:hypothetical protein
VPRPGPRTCDGAERHGRNKNLCIGFFMQRRTDHDGYNGCDALTQVLRQTILALVRRNEADLTSRQFGVFLTVYLTAGPHTVRGLAAELNVSKPPSPVPWTGWAN